MNFAVLVLIYDRALIKNDWSVWRLILTSRSVLLACSKPICMSIDQDVHRNPQLITEMYIQPCL